MKKKSELLKDNKNIWKGVFKEKELKLYKDLTERDIKYVTDYQKLLPILQEDSKTWIDARILHEQLKVVKKFTDWIKPNLENIEAVENDDYIFNWIDENNVPFKGRADITSFEELVGKGYKKQYLLNLDTAKQIAMITGANPRANEDLKAMSKLARKYFIAIERAFKSRYTWNEDRAETILKYYDLREIIFHDLYTNNVLGEYIHGWWNQKVKGKFNSYSYELYLLDLIIIGMSARQYRTINNIPTGTPIRNTFNEIQLEDVHILEGKSAEYLKVNDIWNTDERYKLLNKFYTYYKENKAS